MSLSCAAERIAAEFKYSKKDVNRGVKEFIRQMDEGLQKAGTDDEPDSNLCYLCAQWY
jgi:hexokinase